MNDAPKDCLPESWHKVKVVAIDPGQMSATLDLMVIGGDYAGKIYKELLSFEYCGGMVSGFGEAKLRGICDAIGLISPPMDAREILNIPFMAQGHKIPLHKIEDEQLYKNQGSLRVALQNAKRRFKPATENGEQS